MAGRSGTGWGGRLTILVPYLWLLCFFLAPFIIVLKISFAETRLAVPPYTSLLEWASGEYVQIRLNFGNYLFLLRDALYVQAFLSSLQVAAVSTVFCLALGYPMAYGIAPYDPCPCGSGAKYKFCCAAKARGSRHGKFPIGTVAYYGPDDKGRRRLSDLTGAPAFVFFGFTHCPDACPTTLQKLAMIKSSEVETLKGMRVVLISVDGERDTPAVLRGFLARFSGEFVGLTASPEQVRNLALSFSAPFFKDPPKDGAYAVQHSTRVYALDRQGRLRAELYDASREATIGLARALLAE